MMVTHMLPVSRFTEFQLMWLTPLPDRYGIKAYNRENREK
jgi:hypothetical protein